MMKNKITIISITFAFALVAFFCISRWFAKDIPFSGSPEVKESQVLNVPKSIFPDTGENCDTNDSEQGATRISLVRDGIRDDGLPPRRIVDGKPWFPAERPQSVYDDIHAEIRKKLGVSVDPEINHKKIIMAIGSLFKDYWLGSFNSPAENHFDQGGYPESSVPDYVRLHMCDSDAVWQNLFSDSTNVLNMDERRSLYALSFLIQLGGLKGASALLRDRLNAATPLWGDALVFHCFNVDPRVFRAGGQFFFEDLHNFRESQNPVYQLVAIRVSASAWSHRAEGLSSERPESAAIIHSDRLAFLKPLLDATDSFVRVQAMETILNLGTDEARATVKDWLKNKGATNMPGL